jgi:AcrR family transcriptional regulator
MVEHLSERGYAATTVKSVVRFAGVSPNVFYEHFADKEECFFAAYEAFTSTQLRRVKRVSRTEVGENDFLAASVAAVTDFLDREPKASRAFLVEAEAVGPAVRVRRKEVDAAFAKVLKSYHHSLCRRDPSLGMLPDVAYLGLVHAMRGLICDALEGDPARPLGELTASVVQMIKACILGAALARDTTADGDVPAWGGWAPGQESPTSGTGSSKLGAISPPSTSRTLPVTKLPAGDAR